MVLFTSDTGWEACRQSVRFTTSRLAADPLQKKHEKPFRTLLADWTKTEQARVTADDALVDENALVSYYNDALDEATARLARRLRNDFGGDSHPSFRKFFSEPPSEVIRLGLGSQIERSKDFFIVAEQVQISAEAQAILKEIADVSKAGTATLAARENATLQVARVSLRIQTWKEDGNAARRSIENVLDRYAIDNHLDRDYSARFFPPTARSRKPKKEKGKEPE